jgi:hypothetical protein
LKIISFIFSQKYAFLSRPLSRKLLRGDIAKCVYGLKAESAERFPPSAHHNQKNSSFTRRDAYGTTGKFLLAKI